MAVPTQEVQTDRFRGITVADKKHPITFLHQFGGSGIVLQKALTLPLSQENALVSLAYVSVLAGSSVGAHEQQSDEIHYIDRGAGELVTNGEVCQVRAGDLVLAPRGTTWSVRNLQLIQPFSFLAINVKAPREPVSPPLVMEALPQSLELNHERYRAEVGGQEVPLRLVVIALHTCLAGSWGELTLLELPPACRLAAYSVPDYDENLFVVRGHARIQVGELDAPFLTDEEEGGLNVLVPAGLSRQMTNSSRAEKLVLLSTQIRRDARKGRK